MTTGERIKARRKEIGMTADTLAEKIGVSRSTVFRYENGDIEKIPLDALTPIAAALNTSPAYLMGWELSEGSPANILPMPSTKKVPRLGAIACGEPVLAVEGDEDYDEVPDYVKCDFTLKCKGDSMINARIYDGDIVCIRQQDTVDNGEIAAVIIDDEATLKRVKLAPGQIILWPENPDYEPLIFVGEQMNTVRILGKATHFISSVK